MKFCIPYLLVFLLCIFPFPSGLAGKDAYLCGIAEGFPPYQYTDETGAPTGIDYEIAKMVFKDAGLKILFVQSEWDDVLFNLAHKTGKVNLLCGAEISDARKKLFDFSEPYYTRHSVLFTLKNSTIRQIRDVYGKIIAGDRHSSFESFLGENKGKIRVKETASKMDSFLQLKEGRVVAVIAPREVGYYLGKAMGIDLKIIEGEGPGSPVAFAVEKGNSDLLQKINTSLRKLIREGKIENIIRNYR